MSAFATRSNNWRTGEVLDRLVHPAVADEQTREIQRRLIGVLLAAPFFIGAGIAQSLSTMLGISGTLAAVSACFGAAWLGALAVASTGRDVLAAGIALAVATVLTATVIAGSGGLASPMALLSAALLLEIVWVYRTSRAAALGGGAMLAALLLASVFGAGEPGLAQWLLPIAYAGSMGLRALNLPVRDTKDEPRAVEGLFLKSAICFELDKAGDVSNVQGNVEGLFGLSKNLLYATGLFDRVHVADRVHFLCALADAREGKTNPVELRVRVPGEAPADHFRTFLAEFHGAPESVTAIFRDNGLVGALRGELAEAREKAAEVEVVKGRFLAAVSHELRTPLNSIIGFSDMLLHEVACPLTDMKQREYVTLIRESGTHLLDVVNSILDVSKIESGAYPIQTEPFRFADAVAMSSAMMALQARQKSIAIHERLGANLGELHADRRAMHQILINLVSNAVKFTPAGGEVTIGAKRLGTRLHFWVSDTGIGISEADMERLGEPFMQVQNDYTRQYEGTGLGLSVVKGLVALHDGTMSVESALGEGTTVSISVPVFGPKRSDGRPVKVPFGQEDGESNAAIRKAG
ncbi:MAG TPA: HAMP domain-containing sensor histidine kinase [Rhizobiaceae bacterium]|nr:HAMP domain-containing sensor histidine kinase [Rhizobiaceae bacterium]